MEYTISVDRDDIRFEYDDMSPQTIKVNIDGNGDTSCYDVMTDMDWITISRKLGNVTIAPNSVNNMNWDRNGYIVVYLKNDIKKFSVIDVTQKYNEYSVIVSDEDKELTMGPFPSDGVESKDISVKVNGGRRDFYIADIIEKDSEGNRIVYDNSLEYSKKKISDGEYILTLTSYGRLNRDDVKYEIILSHIDNIFLDNENSDGSLIAKANIMVDYGQMDAMPAISIPDNTIDCTEANTIDASQQAINSRKNAIKKDEQVITPSVMIDYKGLLDPESIDITDGNHTIDLYIVDSVKGNYINGKKVYLDISAEWVGVRYKTQEKDGITYNRATIYASKPNYGGERRCKVTARNRDKNCIPFVFRLKQKGR